MWIFDAYSKGNIVHLWIRKGNKIRHEKVNYPGFFYLYLPDPFLYKEMFEDLETRYRVEECSFKTIYGSLDGYRVYAGRRVAELIERQTKLSAKLYNVDVRLEQRFLAEKGLFACGYIGEGYESRFKTDFNLPCVILDADVKLSGGLNLRIKEIAVKYTVNGDGKERKLTSTSEKDLLSDFLAVVEDVNPDVILLDKADILMESIVEKSKKYNLENPISRTGRFRRLSSKSYHSYGRARYREKAMLPEGRVLIDKSSFNFREGGLKGIMLASRLTGLSPNLAARFTPGTLISSYEVYEALRRGIAIPFRKSDAERQKSFRQLKKVDRGGMIFQPEPGFYENVFQLDFTSMYPSIIVKYNLSPETVFSDSNQRSNQCDLFYPSKPGFLSSAIKPLLELRIRTKKLKKMNPDYEGMDSMLKWLLVTCFGYTGYRNAKFGRIEVHEAINRHAREILLKTKEIAENMGFEVIHGIVDCLWLRNAEAKPDKIYDLKREVERETGLLTELDFYNWIVFLPMADGFGAYNRYYGRLKDGKMKLRGIAARRRDIPSYIRRMQLDVLKILSKAKNREEIAGLRDKIEEIYINYRKNLRHASPEDLVIRKVIGKTNYSRRCAEAFLVNYCRRKGIAIQPGLEVGYIVLDSRKWVVIPEWEIDDADDADTDNVDYTGVFDAKYYEKMLEKAWSEVSYPIQSKVN